MKRLTFNVCLLLVAMLYPLAGARAVPIYAVTGSSPELSCLGVNCFSQVLMVSWTNDNLYVDVSVSAEIGSTDASSSITAYLTNGNSLADLISTVQITPASADSVVTLFSGITLPPGTYFVVMSGPSAGTTVPYWYAFDTPTLTTAPDVTSNGFGVANALDGILNPAYPPGSTFDLSAPDLSIQVTGTLVTSAPEPYSVIQFAIGLTAIGFLASQSDRRNGFSIGRNSHGTSFVSRLARVTPLP